MHSHFSHVKGLTEDQETIRKHLLVSKHDLSIFIFSATAPKANRIRHGEISIKVYSGVSRTTGYTK